MASLPEYYEDLDPEMLVYLTDQHPRGQQILDGMKRRDEVEEVDEPYSEWSLDDLKAELKERKLATTGNKEQMVSRLEKDDES